MSLTRQCGERLLSAGHKINGVVSAAPDLRAWAESKSIPVMRLEDLAGAASFDYLFSIANGVIIPEEILSLARRGAINFHDGPLPEMAGFFTTTQALLRRHAGHGVTWHRMEGQLDAGKIVKEVRFPIAGDETAFTLNAKCYEAAIQSFEEMLAELAAGTTAEKDQDFSRRAYFSRYRRPWGACGIDFRRPAAELEAFSRALDFGPYVNPFGAPVLFGPGMCALAPGLRLGGFTTEPAGTVVRISSEGVAVVAGDGQEIVLTRLLTMDGRGPVSAETAGLQEGTVLRPPEESWAVEAAGIASAVSRHEPFWVERLQSLQPLEWDALAGTGEVPEPVDIDVPAGVDALAVIAAYLARTARQADFDLGYAALLPESMGALFSHVVPLRVATSGIEALEELGRRLRSEVEIVEKARTYSRSLLPRYPELRGLVETSGPHYPVVIDRHGRLAALPEGVGLLIGISPDGRRVRWQCREERYAAAAGAGRLARMLHSSASRLEELPFLSSEEMETLVRGFNRTAGAYDRDATIYSQFEAQAKRTPNAPAVTFEAETLTYAELSGRADRLAVYLQALGVGPETVVAVSMRRSAGLVATLLGVLKAGAAYLPLDPTYPESRVSFLLEDSRAAVLLVGRGAGAIQAAPGLRIVDVEKEGIFSGPDTGAALLPRGGPANLAYVIYTSGSTGQPKGVMVEHGNAVNFFAGMDDELGPDPGVWLAVTSISFDISVLELFWTLTRGFHVILMAEGAALESAAPARRPLDFSLFYFGNSAETENPYRLLMEGARFADENGFTAVWTPERHFHPFGGLYPNPSVTSAALAGITRRVQLRAGSVVVPLHHPVRIAEEWALVDNLSNGRVAISLAPGWNERDFLFAPDNYRRAKQVMMESLATIRALWRGEPVKFLDGKGNETEIRTYPRPVQRELPVWITAAGNPETFRIAGASGCNLLTHLLGQTVEQLAGKIRIYREARREANLDPAGGCVTVMLHTLAGADTEEVRDAVRGPMKAYLLTSMDLIRHSPWSFPVFVKRGEGAELDLSSLEPEEMDALVEHSFQRYFETSGLFGSVERCREMAEAMREAGADEIACLIDFGVPAGRALEGLEYLAQLTRESKLAEAGSGGSFPELMRRHGVTHFQCTPSMAGMIASSPAAAAALRPLRHMLVGGEALPPALAETLRSLAPGELHNMYGPTETTIWSATHRFGASDGTVPIGRPMRNTQIYLLDGRGNLVPPGGTGEICIGGDGVTRGYLHRPELTGERFIPDPFYPGKKLYRTGDLGRFREDGTLDFLGRSDQQVKLRGYRIELMEVEAVLGTHPGIREAAVAVRDDSLIAYVTPRGQAVPPGKELRQWLGERLPEYMVPAAFVSLDRMPQTPNGKLDRKKLPRLEVVAREPAAAYAPPRNEVETAIADAFRNALGVDKIGIDDNFFDLGAHSLLIVQVRNQLQKVLPMPVPLLLLFRFPTVGTLAAHLREEASDGVPAVTAAATAAEDRSTKRQEALSLRLGRRGAKQ
jgi:natural product biosynthesis luciferase-like monooxygenase protein